MKKTSIPTCPGCRRHCTEDQPRCSYGRKYFAKQQKNEEAEIQYKWEAYVSQGGLAWELLRTSCRVKKALKKGKVTEIQLFSKITAEEQKTLQLLLSKLTFTHE